MIGYQIPLDTPERYYQLRFAALVEHIDPPQIDPDKGVIHERAFVPPEHVMDYITFPSYPEALAAAVRWYKNITATI